MSLALVMETKRSAHQHCVAEVDLLAHITEMDRRKLYRKHACASMFVFATDRVRSFWMKNTLIPLDMLFVRADLSIAGIERDTVPLSLDSRSVDIPARYVIEVNGGWTAQNGVKAGSTLRFENLPNPRNPPL